MFLPSQNTSKLKPANFPITPGKAATSLSNTPSAIT
jgi:hypothetical protein